MALATNKAKVSSFAKDINVKSKDLIELLKSNGIDGKTTSSSLEHDELNIILQHYTMQSKVEDIASYLNPETKREEKKEVKAQVKTEANEEKLQEQEKTENKTVEEKKTPVKKYDEKVSASDDKSKQSQPFEKGERQAREQNFSKPKLENSASQGTNFYQREKKPFEQGTKRAFDGERKPPFHQNKTFNNSNQSNRFGNNNTQNSSQMSERQFEKQLSKMSKEGAAIAKQEGKSFEPKYDKTINFDKYSNVKFTKDGFVNLEPVQKQPQKPSYKKSSFNQNRSDSDEDSQSVRQPSLKPVFDKDGRIRSRYAGERIEGASPVRDSDGRVVVDMRTGEVDLSKYDERLDNLVPDALSGEERGGKSSKKKQQNGVKQGAGGRINRNEEMEGRKKTVPG